MRTASQFEFLISGNSTALIIEDNRMMSTLLKSYLEKSNFFVYQAFAEEEAIASVINFEPDVVILDIPLPNSNGYQICTKIRDVFSGPVMVMTSQKGEEIEINAFYAGADDFLVKPVSPVLLKVRAQSLIRRNKAKANLSYRTTKKIGNLLLDADAHKCRINEHALKLSSFEFKLLQLLIDNVGKVLTRDRIYNVLLKRDYNGIERTVDVRMAKLREKLAEFGWQKAQIETVWGQGYVLNEAYENLQKFA